LERNIALAFDGFRKNDWTRGPVTVHLLDLGMPEACVNTLVLERRGACAVQTCRPRNACSDTKLRALCFHVCVKTNGAESRVLPRTDNDIGAESRSRPSPCRHILRQRESSSHGQVQARFLLYSRNLINSGAATPPAHSGMITASMRLCEKQHPVHGIRV